MDQQQPHRWQQQPPIVGPAHPHQPTPPKPRREWPLWVGLGCGIPTIALVAIAVIGIIVYQGGNTPEAKPERQPVASSAPSPSASPTVDKRTLTLLSVSMAWNEMAEARKDDMCNGIKVFGTEWAAEQMRSSTDTNDLDWDYAAELAAERCETR